MGRRHQHLAIAAVLLLAAHAHASDLSAVIATRIKIESSKSTPAGLGVTPTFADFKGRHLREQLIMPASEVRSHARRLQEFPINVQQYGDVVVDCPAGFITDIVEVVVNTTTTAGRKLLANSTGLTFFATMKKDVVTGASHGVYVFNQDAYDYLNIVTKSGSDYKFLRAVLILPDELTATVAPPYFVSEKGFVSPDPSKPVLIKLDTKAAVDGVPNIGVRFDYQSLAPGYTPLFSLYLTSLQGAYPKGLPQADLEISPLAPSIASAVDTVTERLTAGK